MESREKTPIISSEEPEISFEVTYPKEFNLLIARGYYGFVNKYFNKTHVDIPPECVNKKVTVKAKLFKADCHGLTQPTISEIETAGYRVAVFHELLALGIAFPNLQKEFTIIALGSVKKSLLGLIEKVPCLQVKKGVRSLDLVRDFVWKKNERFLAIKIEK